MKILLIHNFYQQPRGEDQVFATEGELLASNGHFVERITFGEKPMKAWLGKLGIVFNFIYSRKSSRLIEQKVKNFYPDIIHIHNFFPLASPSVFYVAKKYHIPIVHTLHNYRLICPGGMLFHRGEIYEKSLKSVFPIRSILSGVYKGSFFKTAGIALMTALHHYLGTWKNRVDSYIALTKFQRSKFEDSALGVAASKYVVKPNFVFDQGRGRLVRDDIFLYAGQLNNERGIKTLIQSAQLYQFKLVILGDGPLRSMVEEASHKTPNIFYLGYKPNEKVIGYMKKCKALIFPSECYEGLPITILEAFSTGTPVIVSKLGSLSEIVQHQYNGLHFEPGNAIDLGNSVRIMLNNNALAKALSINSRITYLQRYSPKVNYKALIHIYQNVLAGQMLIEQEETEVKSVTNKPVSH